MISALHDVTENQAARPHDLRAAARLALANTQLQQFVATATVGKDRGRRAAFAETFGDRYDELRVLAGQVKQRTLDHLDHYLEQFIDQASAAGAIVHYAKDGREANDICIDIARQRGCTRCVKSKSMVTEETGLVAALEAAGVEAIETDLGEFILQLEGEAPSHIVTPMIHKDRTAVGRAFTRELGVEYTDDPKQLAMIARKHLREKYRNADLGISGANFLVAESGSVVLCTNEGNGRFCTTAPRVHIVVAGIEKVVPRVADLGLFLKLLARSSTAQPLTCYTSIITGPRRAAEIDGPEELHIVLLDNGRTRLLRDESRELLRCIRCGACLNACPVYRKIGGHAYGSVYSGPIGAVITPLMRGLREFSELPHASSLCGACFEACPVHIDIPRHLARLRAHAVDEKIGSSAERLAMRVWSRLLRRPWAYRAAARFGRFVLRLASYVGQSHSARRAGWLSRLPGGLHGWTRHRGFPMPDRRSFRAWFSKHEASR